MKKKIYTHIYDCEKCNKRLYYLSNEEYSTKCKTCGSDLVFATSHPYNPKNGIKMANSMNKRGVNISPTKRAKATTPTITCPYCKSTDCRKISFMSKIGSVSLWGAYGLAKATKQWHCNNCDSDF